VSGHTRRVSGDALDLLHCKQTERRSFSLFLVREREHRDPWFRTILVRVRFEHLGDSLQVRFILNNNNQRDTLYMPISVVMGLDDLDHTADL
jgi:hypothetical protein